MKRFTLITIFFLVVSCSTIPKEQVSDIFKVNNPAFKRCLEGQRAKVLFRVRLLPNGKTWEKKVIYKTKVLTGTKPCVEKVLKQMNFSTVVMKDPKDIFHVLSIK